MACTALQLFQFPEFQIHTFNVLGNVARLSLNLAQDGHDLLVLDLLLHNVTLVTGSLLGYVDLLLLLLPDRILDFMESLIAPALEGCTRVSMPGSILLGSIVLGSIVMVQHPNDWCWAASWLAAS